jgi:hypothetical protein
MELATPFISANYTPMNETETIDNQYETLEEQLVGVNAKTGPYVTARSWSGGAA